MDKILVVEDDQDIREAVKLLLINQNFVVDEACNGVQALETFDDSYSILIVDILMPEMDGIQLCQKIRENSNVPILFLTARSSDMDKVKGFSAGGDDYLVKPFSYVELVARVKALIRRGSIYNIQSNFNYKNESNSWFEVGNLKVGENINSVIINGKKTEFTEIEYKILRFLIKHRNEVFSVEKIYEEVWEEPFIHSSSNTVMVHIKNIRNKLESQSYADGVIKTVWGKGYRFEG